jgi:hypothetical protein
VNAASMLPCPLHLLGGGVYQYGNTCLKLQVFSPALSYGVREVQEAGFLKSVIPAAPLGIVQRRVWVC